MSNNLAMTKYAKEMRAHAFKSARAALATARSIKGMDRELYLDIVAFWRNEAAYYIREPARYK